MQEVKNCILHNLTLHVIIPKISITTQSHCLIYFYYYVSSWNLISNLVSPYNITTESQINARRIKEMITK